jgi:hypothetical protein
MKVGGRDFDLTKQEVESLMRNQTPELIQKHVVEVNGAAFPPKQVLGRCTGWPRTSYTTMEAQRVLTRIGFTCREARAVPTAGSDVEPRVPSAGGSKDHEDRIAALEAALAVANISIAALDDRMRRIEAGNK